MSASAMQGGHNSVLRH